MQPGPWHQIGERRAKLLRLIRLARERICTRLTLTWNFRPLCRVRFVAGMIDHHRFRQGTVAFVSCRDQGGYDELDISRFPVRDSDPGRRVDSNVDFRH